MPYLDPETLHSPLPCVNHKTCKGYAAEGRAKCEYCLMADDEEKAAQVAKRLNRLEKKPRSIRDIWRGS